MKEFKQTQENSSEAHEKREKNQLDERLSILHGKTCTSHEIDGETITLKFNDGTELEFEVGRDNTLEDIMYGIVKVNQKK